MHERAFSDSSKFASCDSSIMSGGVDLGGQGGVDVDDQDSDDADSEAIAKAALFDDQVPGFKDMFAECLRRSATSVPTEPASTDPKTPSTAPPVRTGGSHRNNATCEEPGAYDAFARLRTKPALNISAMMIAVVVLSFAGAQLACRDNSTGELLTPERLAIVISPVLSQLQGFLSMSNMAQLTETDLSGGIAIARAGAAGFENAQDGVYLLLFEPRSIDWYRKTATACKNSWPWFASKCLSTVDFMLKHNLETLCLRYVGETGQLLLIRTHQHRQAGNGLPGQTTLRNGRILQVRSPT